MVLCVQENKIKTMVKSFKQKEIISPEFEFFVSSRLTRYQGRYVAILGKKIVAFGNNAKDVWIKARKKYPGRIPTIAKIPKKEIFVLLWK